jgi:DNA repair exonuclease SbcCD ATPase subunit
VNFTLILDVVLIAFLAVTIGYAVALNRKLTGLRRHKTELQQLAAAFTQATQKAEDSIGRVATGTEALQERVGKAQTLRDDLAFLIDRANSAADRLEDAIRTARPKASPGPTLAPAPRAAEFEDAIEPRSDAERELLKAIRAAG